MEKYLERSPVYMDAMDKFCSACKEAVTDEIAFSLFKNNPNINAVLEHCSKTVGDNYKEMIGLNNPHLLNNFKAFWENDKYGSPKIEDFGKIKCSPSTMQYVGVLSNLIDRYELVGAKIIEIGGGYGGQCKIINDYFDLSEYHIVDLPEVGMLQNKYLSKFDGSGYSSKPVWETFTPNSYLKKEYSLVVSNYALSELSATEQMDYVKNILLNSKHGYITCNQAVEWTQLIFDKFQAVGILPDIKGEKDVNFIITW